MTRGKYATRAANARAENAQDTAVELLKRLTDERAQWNTERSELRRQIAHLEASVRQEATLIARDKVKQLTDEHELQLAHLRDQVAEARAYAKKYKDGFGRTTGDLIAMARAEASTRDGRAQVLTSMLRGERAGAAEGTAR